MATSPPPDFAEAVRRVHASYAAAHGKPRYAHKTPLLVRWIPLLTSLFPEAVIVHVLRDPRDVAPAIVSAGLGPRTVGLASALWREDAGAGLAAREELPEERLVEVRYERLVEDPGAEVERLCAALQLDVHEAMLHPEWRAEAMIAGTLLKSAHTRLRSPITAGVRDWRRDTRPADVARIEAIVGHTLVTAGYERAARSLPLAARAMGPPARALDEARTTRRRLRILRRQVLGEPRRSAGEERTADARTDRELIVHVISRDLLRGGQVNARDLRAGLDGDGQAHVVLTLFAARRGALGDSDALDVGGGRLRRAGFDPRAAVALRRWIRRHRPSVVVAHGGEPLKYVAAAAPADTTVVYHGLGTASPKARRGWRRALYGRLARRAAVVVAISREVEREVLDLLDVDAARVRVIPNFRDPSKYTPPPERPARATPRAIFVGHLTRTKRPLLFLEAIADVRRRQPAVEGLVVGGGPLLDVVRRAAPPGVEVLGPRHDVEAVLRDADVFVFTSLPEGEGMPGVLIEAAMAGLASVATRVAGAEDVVIDGVTGFVVGPHDTDGLRTAIERLTGDAVLRRQMGAAARRHAVEHFTIDRAVASWQHALRDATAQPGKRR
jgi:glycosyltransferase involved in cell wall biosynthesis